MNDGVQNQNTQPVLTQNQPQQVSNKDVQEGVASDFQDASSVQKNDALAPFSDVLESSSAAEEAMMREALESIIVQQLSAMLQDLASGSLAAEMDIGSGFTVFSDDEEDDF